MKKILVIQHKMIGDVLISSIICENLKIKYPNSEIHYLVNDNTTPVLEGNPYIDKIVVFGKKEQNSIKELIKFGLTIRTEKYDLLIDAYSKLQSWVITLLSGAKTKISYKKIGRVFLYDYNIPFAKNPKTYLGLAIERRLSLLEPLDLGFNLIAEPKLYVSESEKNAVNELFEIHKVNKGRKTIMISILGSDKYKTYPLQYMSEIVDFIGKNYNVNILFNYFPKQLGMAKEIYNNCSELTQSKIYFEIFGDTLREYIGIMNKCSLIIGNDGGAINMAKALNKKSFIIFSPQIEKKIWATFEDGKNHTSVHLNDFKPDLLKNKSEKQLKESAMEIYTEFKSEMIIPVLKDFLTINID
jgi:ADP-heptose:LPS heptosyltransferase